MPMARMRNVPKKNESPMPASGPMRATFIAEIEEVSNFSSRAFISSMAATIEPMKGVKYIEQLKNSR